MTVLGRGVIGDEVPARGIVDEAVGVVIHAVSGGLARVAGDLAGQILMVRGDPRVDNRDRHAGAEATSPRVGRGDGRHPPEGGQGRVVGRGRDVHRAVGLGVDDVVVGAQLGQRLGDVAVLGLDDLGALDPELVDQLHAGVAAQLANLIAVEAGLALDDDVAFGRLGGRRGEEGGGSSNEGEQGTAHPDTRIGSNAEFLKRATDHSSDTDNLYLGNLGL